MGIKSLVKQSLIGRENRKYQNALNARRMTYADWQKAQAKEQVDIPFDLSEYVVLMAEGSTLAENAWNRIGTYLAQHPGMQVVYGDEDAAGADMPYFKPDWSPDLLECCFYIGSVAVVHRRLLDEVTEEKQEYREFLEQDVSDAAVINDTAPGRGTVQMFAAEQEALRRSLIKDCILRAGGYKKRESGLGDSSAGNGAREAVKCMASGIGHIPEILCHCKNTEMLGEYAKPKVAEVKADGLKNLQGHKLSVIIPSKDHPELVEKCIRALFSTEKQLKLEILVVDNGSSAENRTQCERLLGALVDEGVQIKYFYRPMEFNFSAMCNLGAEQASGDLLLFLNDDVELTLENTLAAMAVKTLQPYTGAVGLKLFYPEGKRIQHAGITNLPMGPVHKLQFMQDDETAYFYANRGSRNMLAVTAACLMVTKDKWKEAGRFPEKLQVAFNDVALCFGLHSLGYYNVVLNDLYAYHHESLSRGDDESDVKLKRLLQEKATLYATYPGLEGVDPYYNVNLSRVGLDTRIRPGYETAGNIPQQIAGVKTCTELKGYRQDNCLMVRVEDCSNGQMVGYAVVLGDDNSCYEMKLLLSPVSGDSKNEAGMDETVESATAKVQQEQQLYWICIEGQYRPDLVENMPDQVNVGLCGFWVQTVSAGEQQPGNMQPAGMQTKADLPAGNYRIGVAARNRVTGTRLLNFSNRVLEIN